MAGPGDVRALEDGVYEEHLQSVNAGLESPIKIVGCWGAIINADPTHGHRAVEIFHSLIHLEVSFLGSQNTVEYAKAKTLSEKMEISTS